MIVERRGTVKSVPQSPWLSSWKHFSDLRYGRRKISTVGWFHWIERTKTSLKRQGGLYWLGSIAKKRELCKERAPEIWVRILLGLWLYKKQNMRKTKLHRLHREQLWRICKQNNSYISYRSERCSSSNQPEWRELSENLRHSIQTLGKMSSLAVGLT